MSTAIKFLFALTLFATGSTAQAGLVGWLTSSTCSWDSVQKTGGIRIGEPLEKDGRLVLPVEYDATGVTGITRRSLQINSALVLRKIESSQSGTGRIVIRVVTQIAENDRASGRMHYADLDDFPPGAYSVYDGDANDADRFLGRIRVR
jgi:hypothetical protein